MVKIGLCSVTFRDKSPKEIVDIIKDTDLECIEWAGDAHVPLNISENDAKDIAKLYPVSSYGSYYHAGIDDNFDLVLEKAKSLSTSDIRIWAGEMDMDKAWGIGDSEQFNKIAKDIKEKAKICQKDGINLNIEHHQWTYADTTRETIKLLEAIDEPNVYLNWQPPIIGSIEDKIEDIKALGPWISNVHVFHWDEKFNRYALSQGKEAWIKYFQALEEFPFEGRKYLLEFVKDDSLNQLKEDINTLAEIVNK